MEQNIIKSISENLKIKEKQTEAVLAMLEEGNTIPFIARLHTAGLWDRHAHEPWKPIQSKGPGGQVA